MPYLSNCVEVWRSAYKTKITAIIMFQKRDITSINKVGYRDTLFIRPSTLKFPNIVYSIQKLSRLCIGLREK